MKTFNITEFGALPDGLTNNTHAIQCAIDTCNAAGGGCVVVSGGTYLSGTIDLKDNVNLRIESDGVLLGSSRCEDYPELFWKHVNVPMLPRTRGAALIRADECSNVAISGNGTIDCNGEHFICKALDDHWMPYQRIDAPTPPRVVMFAGCRNVRVEGVTMTNQPAGWSYWITDCDIVTFDDVKIFACLEYPNNDGIHINSSRDVKISNCTIQCGDDAFVVRANNAALKENKVCERIVITNCTLMSHCNGIRIGWINDGTIRNCVFSNLVMTDTTVGISIVLPGRGDTRISDEGREATLVENLSFDNIIMDRIFSCPVDIAIDSNPVVRCDGIRNISFRGIRSVSHQMPRIIGRSDADIRDISFIDCSFEVTSMPDSDSPLNHGGVSFRDRTVRPPVFSHVRNLHFSNSSFSVFEN